MKIPITMCHGVAESGDKPLSAEHFDRLVKIAGRLGFESISYDDLAAWHRASAMLPERPIMFDFDHPAKSTRYEIHDVLSRYGFGRLWIVGAEYQADGRPIRYADLVGVPGDDEVDGGPPYAARYITMESNPYRLPSMEIQALIYEPEAFRGYLEGAL